MIQRFQLVDHHRLIATLYLHGSKLTQHYMAKLPSAVQALREKRQWLDPLSGDLSHQDRNPELARESLHPRSQVDAVSHRFELHAFALSSHVREQHLTGVEAHSVLQLRLPLNFPFTVKLG